MNNEIHRVPSSGSSSEEKDFSKDQTDTVPTLAREDVEATLRHNYLDRRLEDPNLDSTKMSTIEAVLETGNYKAEVALEEELEDDSPYAEVRAAVSNVDDPTMPVLTFRAWTLGLFFSIVIPAINQLLGFRVPTIAISSFVAQLLAYPMGKFMAAVLPTRVFKTPIGSFTFNPGPFNVKEHTIITVMSNVTSGRGYATNIPIVQKYFYGFDWGYGWVLLITMSTQLIGFSMAGLLRRYLVWPAAMIWPGNLGNTALFSALHRQVDTGEGHMSRYRFFFIAGTASCVWYFFPGYLFSALSYGCWACLAQPKNLNLNVIFGTVTGLGLLPTTLDWTQVTYVSNPLYAPWWTIANVLGSFIIVYVVAAPILWYKNIWYTGFLPFGQSGTFDRFGKPYNTKRVLTADGKGFDMAKYNDYSEEYFPVNFALSYGLSFAAISATIVHVALRHGKTLMRQFRSSLHEERDIHARLMQRYPEIPGWWFIATFVITFALGLGGILGWDTGLPVWAYLISLLIGFIFLLPVGIIQALSNIQVGLNVITEFIIGYMHPGHATGMMLFKTYGYTVLIEGLAFTGDQKLGHYMKIPPRAMFICQVVAIIVANFVSLGVQQFAMSSIKNLCDDTIANNPFNCHWHKAFGSASVIWGLIGPAAAFSPGKQYANLLWMFLVGAILPVIVWGLAKKFPKSFIRLVNPPVMFSGLGLIPPATGINITSWALVGFIFQFMVKRRANGWWLRYNYVLGAALDTGTAISTVIIFFALTFPNNAATEWANSGWWGNSQIGETLDATSKARMHLLKPGESFAPPPKDFRPY